MSSAGLDFCRLCFREEGNVSVFNYNTNDSWSLPDRIFECVSVQISQSDRLPQVICEVCLDQVIKWCEFKTFCDRNQRSWFLWLKSLSKGTQQEICKGLAENARRKSLEPGYGHISKSPRKSAFNQYNKQSAISTPTPIQPRDEVVEDGSCQSGSSAFKEIRIESTHSLVGFSPEEETSSVETPRKFSNGILIIDTQQPSQKTVKSNDLDQSSNVKVSSATLEELNVPIEKELKSNNSISRSGAITCLDLNEDDDDDLVEINNETEDDPVEDSAADKQMGINNIQTDKEMEEEPLLEREVALLNGIEPEEENNPVHSITESTNSASDNSAKKGTSKFPIPDVPKRFESQNPVDILRGRLMLGVEKNIPSGNSSPQPKRPDTPYPHEILKNMAAAVDVLSPVKSLPPPLPSDNAQKSVDENGPSDETDVSANAPEVISESISVLEVTSDSTSAPTEPVPAQIRPLSISNLIQPHLSSSDSNGLSDSSSFYQPNIGMIKQEPLSEPEEDYEDHDFSNISVKCEPLDYSDSIPEQVESGPDIPPPNTTYCDTCLKKFSSHAQLVRHIHFSKIHKRIASFVAHGNKVNSQIVLQITKEIRSQAYFRSCAKKQMMAMENENNINGRHNISASAEASSSDEQPSSSNSVVRQIDSELLECKVCNVVLKSRSFKIKHDNSFGHKCQVEALSRGLEPAQVTPTSQVLTPLTGLPAARPAPSQITAKPATPPLPTYSCPFASCSAAFSDGGQLIVHMHSHGISLPIHEVNKQIELSNKSQVKKAVIKPVPVEPSASRFVCKRCGRAFSKSLSLSNHLRRCRAVSGKPATGLSIPCPVCQVVQKNSRTLNYHMKMYHSQESAETPAPASPPEVKEFSCSVCNKSFMTKLHLRSHVYKVHNQKPVPCKFCKKVYNSRDNLYVHYKTAHLKMKDGEYACYTCFTVFPSYPEVSQHRKSGCTLKMKLLSCSDCGKSFRNQSLLEKHQQGMECPKRDDSNDPLAPLDLSFLGDVNCSTCKICGREYSSYYNVRRHVRMSHLDESCNLDEMIKASVANNLNSLIKEELELPSPLPENPPLIPKERKPRNSDCIKNFPCLYCDSKFSTNSNRLNHMKTACKFVPPKEHCLSCNAERWPWISGICKNCGKNLKSRKRPSSFKGEIAAKKIKLDEEELMDPAKFIPQQVSMPQQLVFQLPVSHPNSVPVKAGNSSKVPVKLYKCSAGKRTFLSQKTMLNHSVTCNGECKDQGVYCKTCHQVFPNPKVYIKHKPCTGKRVQKSAGGRRVFRANDPHRVIPCNFCDSKFKSRKIACHHMRTIHNYYASVERKRNALALSGAKNNLTANKSTSDVMPFQESADPVSSTSQEIVSEENEKPGGVICPVCSRSCVNHFGLVQHCRTFHKNKFSVLECTFCSKSILKRQLYEHGFACIKEQLANISTLECVQCSTVFYNSDEEDTLSLKLQEHIMNCCGKLTLGKGERFKNREKFLCLKCCMLFSSKKSLYAHSFERHGILVQTSPPAQLKNNINIEEEIDMSQISRGVPLREETDSIIEIESETSDSIITTSTAEDSILFKCSICPKGFKTPTSLRAHKASVHHNKTHKTKKNAQGKYKCKFCQRPFRSETKLRNHEKVHGIVKEVVRTEEEDIAELAVPLPPSDMETVTLTKQEVAQIVATMPASES